MQPVLITVVMCTYNRASMLRDALKRVVSQETRGVFSYDVAVIDDGSTDATPEVIAEIAASASVPVRHVWKEGSGYTDSMNRGVAEATGEWIAFYDDDELAEPNWLAELYAVTQQKGAMCVGGPYILDLSPEDLNELSMAQRAMCGENMYYDRVQTCAGNRLPGGGNMMINRAVFSAIGGFDPAFATMGCDRDFLLRAGERGFPVWYTPHAIVRHRIPPNRLTTEYAMWNSLQYGAARSFNNWRRLGGLKTGWLCLARVAQAVLVNVPLLAGSYVCRNRKGILDRKIRMWRAEGYARGTARLAMPNVFPQDKFFARMSFRRGREVEKKNSVAAATAEQIA